MPPAMTALVVAAGSGFRAGGGVPKQYRDLAGIPVLARTVARFGGASEVIIVIGADQRDLFEERVAPHLDREALVVTGGADRADSVRAGLARASSPRVLIHDAVRPLVSDAVIAAVAEALDRGPAAAPAVPVVDALWRGGERIAEIVDRSALNRAQTPQGFHTDVIRKAHETHGNGALDDAAVAVAAGIPVEIVPGDDRNIKITRPGDFDLAARFLNAETRVPDIRLGNGFDVHRFGPGDHVTLCGVKVPHDRGLVGHSDADVGLHAVTDAIYGALARGDIGRHFPPDDPRWAGADSRGFLSHAAGLARDEGYTVSNVDLTLVCERPRIGPHAIEMTDTISRILGVDANRVSVKATTSERLGFTGRGEGIAAFATAALARP